MVIVTDGGGCDEESDWNFSSWMITGNSQSLFLRVFHHLLLCCTQRGRGFYTKNTWHACSLSTSPTKIKPFGQLSVNSLSYFRVYEIKSAQN